MSSMAGQPRAIALVPMQPAQNSASNSATSQGCSSIAANTTTSPGTASIAGAVTHNSNNTQSQLSASITGSGSSSAVTSGTYAILLQRCNNVYMALAMAVGLVMTFVGFKISLDSYRLSVWTSRKDFIELCIEMQATRNVVSTTCEKAIRAGLPAPPVLRPRDGSSQVADVGTVSGSPDSVSEAWKRLALLSFASLAVLGVIAATSWTIWHYLIRPLLANLRCIPDLRHASENRTWVPTTTARAHEESTSGGDQSFLEGMRRRRLARFQPEDEQDFRWNDALEHEVDQKLFNHVCDAPSPTIVLPAVEKDSESLWLPVKSQAFTITYLEKVWQAALREELSLDANSHAALRAARLISFYACLITDSQILRPRFNLNYVDTTSLKTKQSSRMTNWIGYSPSELTGTSNPAEWQALKNILSNMLPSNRRAGHTLTLPTSAEPSLNIFLHNRRIKHSSTSSIASSKPEYEQITGLLQRYSVPFGFRNISFAWLPETEVQILVTVECEVASFKLLKSFLFAPRSVDMAPKDYEEAAWLMTPLWEDNNKIGYRVIRQAGSPILHARQDELVDRTVPDAADEHFILRTEAPDGMDARVGRLMAMVDSHLGDLNPAKGSLQALRKLKFGEVSSPDTIRKTAFALGPLLE